MSKKNKVGRLTGLHDTLTREISESKEIIKSTNEPVELKVAHNLIVPSQIGLDKNDQELYNQLFSFYNIFIDKAYNGDTNIITQLFNNKVLPLLTQVFQSIDVYIGFKVKLNYLILTYGRAMTDDYGKSLMKSLAKVINKDTFPLIVGLGFSEDVALDIAMLARSNPNDEVNVMNVNHYLNYLDPKIMTEQMIVWIYEKLFDRVIPIFEGVMFDADPDPNLTDEQLDTYGNQGLAALTILNNMESFKISAVLENYANNYAYSKAKVRFSLYSISEDFYRISQVVTALSYKGVYIP